MPWNPDYQFDDKKVQWFVNHKTLSRDDNSGGLVRPEPTGECHVSDRISDLSDDVLLVILSYLTVKDAGRTSVLSSRWTNLWTYITRLHFEDKSALQSMSLDSDAVRRNLERAKYIKFVNKVLRSHNGLTLEEFRIRFELKNYSSEDITNWLEFAFARNVERLELNLSGDGYATWASESYVLPRDFLFGTSRRAPRDVKALKVLSLTRVNVTDEVFEYFLRSCPLLEKLSVDDSNKLENPKVCGSSLRLKELEICNCSELNSVRISAPNLTFSSFKVTKLCGIFIENVPMLIKVFLRCERMIDWEIVFDTLRCCVSQLEFLYLKHISTYDRPYLKFPELSKLKTLVVEFLNDGRQSSFMGLTHFLRASPYLEEFVLKIHWKTETQHWVRNKAIKDAKETFQHQHLKVVKFEDFHSRSRITELLDYLLETCVVLEKIILDTRLTGYRHRILCPDEVECWERTTKIAAQNLEAQLPHHIQLLVL